MPLREWLKSQGRGSQQKLAQTIGVSETWMSLLVNGRVPCSPALATAIHQVTEGAVTRLELRPDIFGAP
jgi:DNA-binding transcriptional regulator YdaS (Cro superfamily)